MQIQHRPCPFPLSSIILLLLNSFRDVLDRFFLLVGGWFRRRCFLRLLLDSLDGAAARMTVGAFFVVLVFLVGISFPIIVVLISLE